MVRITRRHIGAVLGLVLLAYTFYDNQFASVFQVLAGGFLTACVVLLAFSRVPVKVWIGALRLAALASALFVGVSMVLTQSVASVVLMVALLLSGFGSYIPYDFRRPLYASLLWLGWIILGVSVFSLRPTEPQIVFIALPFFIALSIGYVVTGNKPNVLEQGLQKMRIDAQATLAALDNTPPSLERAVHRFTFSGFENSLRLARVRRKTPMIAAERIENICRRFPHLQAGWQLAYLAKLLAEDFQGAVNVLNEAKLYGFTDAYFERAIAFGLYQLKDPTWRLVLEQAWRKAQTEGRMCAYEHFFSMQEDPTRVWLVEGPIEFVILRKHLGQAPFGPPPGSATIVATTRP